MAFLYRINRFKPKYFSNQFQRHYFHIPHSYSLISRASGISPCVTKHPFWVIHNGPTGFCDNVRFFAAPVQAKPKKEERDSSKPRLNEEIRSQFVRLVTENGHSVVSRREALERAKTLKLDLVEVARNADPPVCRIVDFHRDKYKQQLKEKDRAKVKSEVTLRKGDCKEVRFSGKAELKDIKMKADAVKRLMERGYRVKCRAMGKQEDDLGGLLSRVSAMIEDVSVVESGPQVRETEAHMIVRHVKFGPSKKGGGKKLKVVGDKSAEVLKATTTPAAINSVGPVEELSSAENGSETEEEILSDEDDHPVPSSMEIPDKNLEDKKNAWSVVDASDDFDRVFSFGDDVNVVTSSSTGDKMNTAPETASPSPNVNVSDFIRPTPALDSRRANLVPSSSQEPPFGTESRYKRSEPRNRFPPTKSVDNNGPGIRDSNRLEPQFPNQRVQPPTDMNVSPSMAETRKVGTDASAFRNVKLPPNNMPKHQPSPPAAPSTPAPSFGIFSAPKGPGKQGVAAEVQRNREGNLHDSIQKPSTGRVSPNPDLPNLNSVDSPRLGLNKGGQGGWGTFSRESSNVISNRTSKPN